MNNIDPNGVGRLLVQVPDVTSLTPTSWAMPCAPLAGPGGPMGVYMVPPIGSSVWVEFENGDPDYPVWVGCFWGQRTDVPADVTLGNPALPSIVLASTLQNVIVIADVPGPTGGITLRSTSGASIMVNDLGITIQNGKGASITLVGPAVSITGATVTVNNGALVVT